MTNPKAVPDLSKVTTPNEAIKASEDPDQLAAMVEEATNFIESFEWCREITERYVGLAVPGVVGVFLFHIVPQGPDVDEWVWVIVGDVPPAYISPVHAPNPAAALDGYIGEMKEWVNAVNQGRSTEDLIPVNVPPTEKYADMLNSRLSFIEREILSGYSADLGQ